MSATLAEVEVKLRAAMDAARADGVTIVSGYFFVEIYGAIVGCCAVGAVLRMSPGPTDVDEFAAAAVVLDVPQIMVESIISGFDGESANGKLDVSGYDLGRRLRADYLGAP